MPKPAYVNLRRYVKEIVAHLKKNAPKDLKEALGAALGEKGVGLIINERVINIPQEVGPGGYRSPRHRVPFDSIKRRGF
jgi:hypothetical protein